MSHIADLVALGDLPAQHFGAEQQGWQSTRVNLLRKVRYLGRDPNTRKNKIDARTLGFSSVDGCWLPSHAEDPDGNRRDAALWAHAVPATTQAPSTTGTQAANPYAATTRVPQTTTALPAFSVDPQANFSWLDDTGVIPQPVASPTGDLPGGIYGIALPMTVWTRQDTAFVPAGNQLVDPWHGGPDTDRFGTIVWDVTADGKLDRDRRARIPSAWRTYRLPQTALIPFGAPPPSDPKNPKAPPSTKMPSGIAWQLELDVGSQAGWGMVAEKPDDGGGAPGTTPPPIDPRAQAIADLKKLIEQTKQRIAAAAIAAGGAGATAVGQLNDELANENRQLAALLAGYQPGQGGFLGGFSGGTIGSPAPPGGSGPTQTKDIPAGMPKQTLGATGRSAGGFINAGGGSCPHLLGITDDPDNPEPIRSAHIDELALIRGATGDAPFKFDLPWIPPTETGPFWREVFCRNDTSDSHAWIPDGKKPGLRKWETTSYHDQPPPPTMQTSPGGEPGISPTNEGFISRPGTYADPMVSIGDESTSSPATERTTDAREAFVSRPGTYADPLTGGGQTSTTLTTGTTEGLQPGGVTQGGGPLPGNSTPPSSGGGNVPSGGPPAPGQGVGTYETAPWIDESTVLVTPGVPGAATGLTGGARPGDKDVILLPTPQLSFGGASEVATFTGGPGADPFSEGDESMAPAGTPTPVPAALVAGLPFGWNFLEQPGPTGNPLAVQNSVLTRPRSFVRQNMAAAVSALLAYPPSLTGADLQVFDSNLTAGEMAQYNGTPVAAQLVGYGAQLSGHTFLGPPSGARWRGGSSLRGGFATLPSNVDQRAWQLGRPLPPVLPDTYMVMGTRASQLAWASGLTTSGLPADGYVAGIGTNTTWSLDWADSVGKVGGAGVGALPPGIFLDSGQNPVDPPPTFQAWGGQVMAVWNTTAGQAAKGSMVVPDGTNAGPGVTFIGAGASGTVWTSNGAGNNPSWQSPASTSGLPTGYINGLQLVYASSTTFTVKTGKARSKADASDITLISSVLVDMTASGATGSDFVAGPTASAAANSNTATLNADLRPTLIFRTGTGTISTAGTAVTGTGTKFTTEVAVGDIIGDVYPAATTASGWAKVTAIASDTSLTLSAALPGGNLAAGSAFGIVENIVFSLNAGGYTARQVSTLSANGLTLVADLSWSASAQTNVATRVGDFGNSHTFLTTFYTYVWVGSGGTGTTAFASSQRTTPFSVSGYTTNVRRIGALFSFLPFTQDGIANERRFVIDVAPTSNQFLVNNTGAQAGWTSVYAGSAVPPTSMRMLATASLITTTSVPSIVYFRPRNSGDATVSRAQFIRNQGAQTGGGTNGEASGLVDVHLDGAQYYDYSNGNQGAPQNYLYVHGYIEYI